MTPVVVDVGRRHTRRVLVAGSVVGVLGVASLVGAAMTYADGEGVGGTIGLVLGVLFTGIAMIPAVTWRHVSRPRRLVLDEPGVRWHDPAGAPWAVTWPELGAVRVSRTRERVLQPADGAVRRTLVRLDLLPADPAGFRARHADMAHLAREDGTYRLPLGDAAARADALERAVLRFAPHLYRGVRDEGIAIRLT